MARFPVINHISDVLPALDGKDEFIVANRESYSIINYRLALPDTFLDPGEDGIGQQEQLHRALRMEARGIIFDNHTGNIIRRPLHKFKNVNESAETHIERLDFSKPHHIDTKLDGSMIAPFISDNQLIWGTKMVANDFHLLVEEFVEQSGIDYANFCKEVIGRGFTPIFEFTHPDRTIIIDYGDQPALTLLACRHMQSGQYHNFGAAMGSA